MEIRLFAYFGGLLHGTTAFNYLEYEGKCERNN